MKVILYQINITWEDKNANFVCVEKKLKEISSKNVDLFLLPEMSFTGYSMNTNVTKEDDQRTIKRMTYYARKYDVAVGFGWVKDCGERSENHYTVINKRGDVISDYVKLHPFSYAKENERFQGGRSIVTFPLEDLIFSSFICYDLRFPEIFQIASKTVDVILVAANWPKVRSEHWKCLLRARAIENQVYIIGINCVGNINGVSYSGDSCIISPEGNILVELSGQEGVLEYEIENEVPRIRNKFPVRQDRREELYDALRIQRKGTQ